MSDQDLHDEASPPADDGLRASADRAGAEAAGSSTVRPALKSALILEDNITVAYDVESLLRDIGLDDIVVAISLAEARAAVAERAFDVHLLDLHIGGTTSVTFAEGLAAAGQRIVFTTGRADFGLSASIRGIPVLDKPYASDLLVATLRAL